MANPFCSSALSKSSPQPAIAPHCKWVYEQSFRDAECVPCAAFCSWFLRRRRLLPAAVPCASCHMHVHPSRNPDMNTWCPGVRPGKLDSRMGLARLAASRRGEGEVSFVDPRSLPNHSHVHACSGHPGALSHACIDLLRGPAGAAEPSPSPNSPVWVDHALRGVPVLCMTWRRQCMGSIFRLEQRQKCFPACPELLF